MKLVLADVRLPLAPFVLEIERLELAAPVTALFGPSGAGKTSVLDLLAGLRRAASAYLELDGRVLTDTARRIAVPARQRRIGYVPQDLALFPHLSVRANLLYGRGRGDSGGPFALDPVVEVLEVGPLLGRGVGDLSGGERQRVALARALLASPRLLLLDEPLAALDHRLKERVIPYLRRVRDELGVPMLYVTHDTAEVQALCDDVVLLRHGRLVGRSTPAGLAAGDVPPQAGAGVGTLLQD